MAGENKTSMWVRIAEIIGGIIVIVLGGYVLAYPGVALATLAAFLAIALIILGILSFVRIFDHGITGWQRLLNLILAIIEIAIAAMIIGNVLLGIFTIIFLLGLGLLFAGLAAASRGTAGSIVVGILGIIAGFIVIINPVIGGLTMVALTSVFLIIFGLELLVSGFLARWV
jgi:uncharacterized membrane protein HdeD (DUF308 family)